MKKSAHHRRLLLSSKSNSVSRRLRNTPMLGFWQFQAICMGIVWGQRHVILAYFPTGVCRMARGLFNITSASRRCSFREKVHCYHKKHTHPTPYRDPASDVLPKTFFSKTRLNLSSSLADPVLIREMSVREVVSEL